MILAIVVFLLFLFVFGTNQSIWMPALDFYQLLFCLLFVNVVLPPNAAYALAQFRITAFTFIPNMFSSALDALVYNSKFGNTIFTFFGDMVFLRTMGYLYTVLLVLVVVILLCLLFWKKKFKYVKPYAKKFLKETFWHKHLHGLVYVLFLPTFIVGLMKMRDYTASTAIQGFSIFSSYLFMLPMLAVPIFFTVKVVKLVKNYPTTCKMLNKGYEYICGQ